MVTDRKAIHDKILETYALYPRKMGKSAGVSKAIRQCKTYDDAILLGRAVVRYIMHITQESTEKQYILYFSTFMNQWRDWLEPETGSVIQTKVDLNGLGFK